MLTPALVCFMPFCPMEAQASSVSQVEPCHAEKTEKTGNDALMMVYDCLNVDLFYQAGDQLTQPDQHHIDIAYTPYDINAYSPSHLIDVQTIRGPPSDSYQYASLQPSIILTTQRFRI